ncbi:hypothetical protein HanRHA438_Chr08g0360641 [Helianthus annuus]|nr:hypothetical protein HanRHA438_Chr08g0360641 [Helianthus annuus]
MVNMIILFNHQIDLSLVVPSYIEICQKCIFKNNLFNAYSFTNMITSDMVFHKDICLLLTLFLL